MKHVTASELRERIRFDRRATVADDGYGNTVGDWATYAGPMSARIRPVRGREEVLARKLTGVHVFEITVRYHDAVEGLTTDDRAVNTRTSETYNVRSVENSDERRRWLSILVELGVPD